MDDQDSPSTIGKKVGDGAKLSLAWDKFYAHCSAIIHECPSVRRLSAVDREDCVQEVMVELVRKFNERHPDSGQDNLTGWIRAISRNKAVDIVRRRYRKPEVSFDDGAGQAIRDRDCWGVASSQQGEDVSLVWESLLSMDNQVPVTSYLIFYLQTMEGWKVGEIAELFQISPEQVRARSHRVKKKFGSILETKGREGSKAGPS